MAVRLLALLLGLALPQEPAPATATWRNLNGTFQLELPRTWRTLAPNEAVRIGENPRAPTPLRLSQPRDFYPVGPVDAWLAGDFAGPWLYVVEQREPWHLADDFTAQLRDSWQRETAASGVAHDLRDVHREKVGTQAVEAVVAQRSSSPPSPQQPWTALDVYAPTGNQQISLSFGCAPADFDRWLPEFRRWLATLTLARPPAEPATLSDRLWTPLVTGAAVGLLLLVLYKHTRGRR